MSKKNSNSKNSKNENSYEPNVSDNDVEKPPLNDDGPEWDDYAYTADDF